MKRDWARYGSVVQMRREGKTFAQIAAVLGVSTTRVQQMEAIAINGMAVGKGITELLPLTPRETEIFERYKHKPGGKYWVLS